jgi:acetyl esterase/lipase
MDPPLDLARVSVIGHSAGGHLALWAAGREKLPSGAPGADPPRARVPLRRAIALAGVCDLAGAYRDDRSKIGQHGGAVRALMGGSPDELPERYALGDPLALVPLRMPVLLVHGVLDETVSVKFIRNYARAALLVGGEVELVEIAGEAGRHRAHIDPRGSSWEAVMRWLVRPARGAPRAAPGTNQQYERASSTSRRTP